MPNSGRLIPCKLLPWPFFWRIWSWLSLTSPNSQENCLPHHRIRAKDTEAKSGGNLSRLKWGSNRQVWGFLRRMVSEGRATGHHHSVTTPLKHTRPQTPAGQTEIIFFFRKICIAILKNEGQVFNQFIELHSLKCFCCWFCIKSKRCQTIFLLRPVCKVAVGWITALSHQNAFLKVRGQPSTGSTHCEGCTAAQWEIQPTVKPLQHMSVISRIQYKIILAKACKILHQVQSQWLFLP